MLASIPFESDARYESDENENNAEKKTLSRERERFDGKNFAIRRICRSLAIILG